MTCTNCTCDTVGMAEHNAVCEGYKQMRIERNRLYSALKLIVAMDKWEYGEVMHAPKVAEAALEDK